ncbi:MAG: murein DD-endopeptidase [Psychromonas sp.]|jgi:murein DD-endopeptidase|uniref:peptidoglycan DD-metalloendopeptidase family protein n=1 Tax=Psychromonas sp. TaxID=1884585 RepID=UPI0039E28009
MLFLLRLKAFFKSSIAVVNNLPRKHFFALILLFVFLLVVSLVPLQPKTKKTVYRSLELPERVVIHNERASAEPLTAIKDEYGKLFPDFSGNREVEFEVGEGDSLSNIFEKESLSAAALQNLLEADTEYLRLGNLIPGQSIKLLIGPDNNLLSLKVFLDIANTLTYTLKEDHYDALLETKKGQWRTSLYKGRIIGSFYNTAKASGLTAAQIQQVSVTLQDKIDFNRQLYAGDTFRVLVSKQYIDGQYSSESDVLAILIKSRNKSYTAFLHEDGRYYDINRQGLSKAYRRYPVNGRPRISSPFNPRRLHPITKRISPHNGTDFAVSTGTKVYSVGDGVVLRAGYHPAAGNYIVIQNSRKYTTRFLHLSKILVRKGQRVSRGDLIARSGNTGRSTGAHLHYEFQINNRAVDAMKVSLPLSTAVSKKEQGSFDKRRDLYLKEMGVNDI